MTYNANNVTFVVGWCQSTVFYLTLRQAPVSLQATSLCGRHRLKLPVFLAEIFDPSTSTTAMRLCTNAFSRLIATTLSLGLLCAVTTAQNLEWRVLGSLRLDRHHHKARHIGNGDILVIGGYSRSQGVMRGTRTATCEIINIRNGNVRDAAPLSVERGIVDVVTSPDGAIYVIGGDTDNGPTDLVERYNVKSDRWEIVGRLRRARWQQSSVFISATEILIAAGWQEKSAEIFDVTTGTSTVIADFPSIANSLVPIKVRSLAPALIGGRTGGPNTSITSSAVVYDRINDRWQEVCEFSERAVRPTAISLMDGRSLVLGGVESERPFKTQSGIDMVKDLYDVARLGELQIGRVWHGAHQWSDGNVLVVGGFIDGEQMTETTEWFHPVKGTMQSGPSMSVPRTYVELVSLIDEGAEYLVVVSGLTSASSGTPLVEIMGNPCSSGTEPISNRMLRATGNAIPRDNTVELTSATPFQRGAVWSERKVSLRERFSTLVGFRFTNGDDKGEQEELPSVPGADGIAVVIQNEGLEALGQYGRGIGYDGIKRSIAVEVDTYQNTTVLDPDGNHIGLQSMGKQANSSRHAPPANLGFSNAIPKLLADGTTYYMYLDYADKRLRVYLNDRPVFTQALINREIDIDSLIGLDSNGMAWIGITSATGQSVEQHEIVRWEINGCAAESTVSVPTQPTDHQFKTCILDGTRLLRSTSDVAQLSLVDVRGKIVWRGSTEDREIDLSPHVLHPGWFTVVVESAGTTIALPLVIIR